MVSVHNVVTARVMAMTQEGGGQYTEGRVGGNLAITPNHGHRRRWPLSTIFGV